MRKSTHFLPMTKPEAESLEQLRFCTASEAIGAYHARVAGKILLISDGEAVHTLAPFCPSILAGLAAKCKSLA